MLTGLKINVTIQLLDQLCYMTTSVGRLGEGIDIRGQSRRNMLRFFLVHRNGWSAAERLKRNNPQERGSNLGLRSPQHAILTAAVHPKVYVKMDV